MDQLSTCDVVIIGSGAGGATLAGELARAGLSVIMLEAGMGREGAPEHVRNADPSEAGLASYADRVTEALTPPSEAAFAPEGLPGMRLVHGVGGMLGYWMNYCPWPHASELGACIPQQDWQQLLQRSAGLLGPRTDLYNGFRLDSMLAAVSRALGPREAGREVSSMPVAADRAADGTIHFRGADALLPSGDAAACLSLRPGVIVHEILHSHGRARGVRGVSRLDGAPIRVDADVVIVAGGTVGTPQLLAATGVGGPALGRYIHEHPTLLARIVLRKDIRDAVPPGDPLFNVLSPYSDVHPWQHSVFRVPAGFSAGVDAPERHTVDVASYTPVEARESNRLIFDADRLDPFGLPRVSAEYRLSSLDRERISAATAEHLKIVFEIGELERGWSPSLFPAGASFHLAGSCRMGVDSQTSVVNTQGRVWGFENLYAVGNSALPVASASNPTLMTVAFALRCADGLLERGQTESASSQTTGGAA